MNEDVLEVLQELEELINCFSVQELDVDTRDTLITFICNRRAIFSPSTGECAC